MSEEFDGAAGGDVMTILIGIARILLTTTPSGYLETFVWLNLFSADVVLQVLRRLTPGGFQWI